MCIDGMALLHVVQFIHVWFLKYMHSFLMVFNNVAVCPRPPERQWISLQPDRSRNPAREFCIVSYKIINYMYM